MTIIDKQAAMRRYKFVPLECAACGSKSSIKRPDGPTVRSLVNAGNLRELRHELAILLRADDLFHRFPKSRHPLKASHEHSTPNDVPSDDDREFAQELSKDRELNEHLLKSGFLLSARLPFVTRMVADLATAVGAQHRPCSNCGTGILAPDTQFFSELSR